jgi:hypothetical protein
MAENRKLNIVLDLVNKVSGKLTPLEKDLDRTGKKMQEVGRSMTLGITAPLALAAGAFVKAAADAEETENRFRQVFGSLSDDAGAFADELGDAVGRSSIKIMDGLSTFQSFSVGMGFAREEASEMSKSIQTLALDFASFNNISDDEAMQRFISALSGSSEVLDRFGINIKQSALDLELQAQGLANSTSEATEQQKVIARLAIIMRAMTDQGATGDAIRTQDSFTNQMKRLNDAFLDFRVQLGRDIIPALTGLVTATGNALEKFNGLSDGTRKSIIVFATFLAVLGPASMVVGGVTKALIGLRTAMIAARVASIALLGPWMLVVAAAAAVAGIVGVKLFSANKDATQSTAELEAQIASLAPNLPDLAGGADGVAGAFGNMGDQAQESAKKITDLHNKAKEAFEDLNADEADSKRSLAEALIEQEKKVSDIKSELRSAERAEDTDQNASSIRELRASLETETKALKSAKWIQMQFKEEVLEAERRADLTAFERQIEDIQRRRIERLKEHIVRLQEIQLEIQAEEAKNRAIQASYAAAQANMRAESDKTKENALENISEQQKAIERLARSMDSLGSHSNSTSALPRGLSGARADGGPVGAGKSYLVGERGPEIFTPGSSGGITANHDIGGRSSSPVVNVYLDSKQIAARVEAGMARAIQRRIRTT